MKSFNIKNIVNFLCIFWILIASEAFAIPITVEVNWPNWASDNRVSILDTNGITVLNHSGPAPTDQICDPTNCFNASSNSSHILSYTYDIPVGIGYTIVMDDAFGDGWNGAATVTINNGGTPIFTSAGPTATTLSAQFDVSSGGGSGTVNCGTDTGSGYATGGTGAFSNNIFWLDWSCSATTQFNAGGTYEKSWNTGNGIIVTAILSNITANMEPYNTGNWSGDILDNLYSGVNPIGLVNVTDGQDPSFDISFTVTRNGNPISPKIVIADAEDNAIGTVESLEFTTSGTSWQPIEATGTLDAQFSNSGNTLTLVNGGSSEGPGTLLALTENASTINIDIQAGGRSAVAFGVFVNFDHGDANNISSNGHYISATANGGSQPTSATAVTSLTLANVQYGTDLFMGTINTDTEQSHQSSATANGDDANGVDDEDGVASFPALTAAATSYTIATSNFNTITGSGNLYAWIDFDGSGSFDADEFASTTVVNGVIQSDLTFSGFGSTISAGSTIFARFRLTTDTLTNTNAATSASNGEVEDYQLTINAGNPIITLIKSVVTIQDPVNGDTNPKAIPGALTEYTITATNTGLAPADNNTITITDTIPNNTALYVGDISGPGSGPIRFIDGSSPNAPSGLSLGSVTYLNSSGVSIPPTADAEGVNTNIVSIRISTIGPFLAASASGDPSFQILFRVKVQ